jgi:hypothetical protein
VTPEPIEHVLSYGQSLSTGWDGWPVLSRAPRPGTLMLGGSVRGVDEAAPRWAPLGRLAFRPLIATAQDIRSGRLLPEDPPPEGEILGETVLEGALAFWAARREARAGALLASACGVGGRTLEKLSRGAEPELFNRLRDCVRLAHLVARAEQRDYRIAAVLLLQGESNVAGEGARERSAYKALLNRLIDDILGDLAAGQGTPPAILLYQTSGAYAEDAMGVAQAQLELALARPGVFVVGPTYPYPETRGHMDGNGYRWLGAQFGKVLHRAVTLGEAWRPLHPTRARLVGQTVRLAFSVPHPPLAWGQPFVGLQRCHIADRGFTVLDATGPVPIADVSLDGAEAVALRLARPPAEGSLLVRYAERTRHHGRGMLHDSDPTVAEDAFVADFPGSRYTPADAAALGGRHYALVNWCAAFAMAVERMRPTGAEAAA